MTAGFIVHSYTFHITANQTVHFKYIQFTVCQLFLNKTVKTNVRYLIVISSRTQKKNLPSLNGWLGIKNIIFWMDLKYFAYLLYWLHNLKPEKSTLDSVEKLTKIMVYTHSSGICFWCPHQELWATWMTWSDTDVAGRNHVKLKHNCKPYNCN